MARRGVAGCRLTLIWWANPQTVPRLSANNYIGFNASGETWSVRCANEKDAATFVRIVTLAAAHSALHGSDAVSPDYRVMNRLELGEVQDVTLADKV